MYTDKIMAARIYKSFKSPTQSGKRNLNQWVLEFITTKSSFVEPVMGWTGGYDTLASEVKLYFSSKEEAINYAANNKIEYELLESVANKITYKAYVNNYIANKS